MVLLSLALLKGSAQIPRSPAPELVSKIWEGTSSFSGS